MNSTSFLKKKFITEAIIEDVPKHVGSNLVFGTSFFLFFFSPDVLIVYIASELTI